MPLMLNKWEKFVQQAIREVQAYVFDCVFLQNPMCETMMRFGYDITQLTAYISELAKIIKPLNPAVIDLHSDAIAQNVKRLLWNAQGGWRL